MTGPSLPSAGGTTAQDLASVAKGGSFRGILKSSALIGASSMINVGLGAVRTKAMAVLLGPAGFGLMGAFGMVLDLARSVAQLGLNGSGVRQIAEASSSGEEVGSSRVDLQACKLEYSIVSPK